MRVACAIPLWNWEVKEAIERLANAIRASDLCVEKRMCTKNSDNQQSVLERELPFKYLVDLR
ncbi:hypothetical protein BWQ96_02221 [Gracilariopsis chorda]|uniref:Uncharacterized protein n=1 Tax=Gracilariopsis chorda TaxID=448386 RepID=A0A2V3J3R9_9FLOR|nr:hypothetical protein BWQ96_02221 [Gracilariopsis chorda]|eukprot:PXF48030.1 hypothetical protein BWQ96_02221 [Gracilariopsis chorda]